MDLTIAASSLGAKAGQAQMQIAMTLIKNDADAERAAVQTLLSDVPQAGPLANVPSGVGGKVDVTA